MKEKQEQKKRQEEKKKRLLKDTNSYRAPKTQDPAKTDDEDPPTWRHQLADFVDWWPFQASKTGTAWGGERPGSVW